MAMSPSPQLSPVMGGSHRVERHHSNSPPQQQLSKRDKRRGMLADRLDEITKQFSQNRDVHYREQLQAIQVDMNLIMEADPHGKEQLKNSGSEIDGLVQDNMKKIAMKSVGPIPPPRAGRIYADFAKEVNDAMEERDTALTVHKRDFDVKMSELAAADAYRRKLAGIEHHHLSSTLRDRLINSVTNKKNRLSRDRETIEIGESNALLLHPSQYGLANPASPGGMHGKRATRHRRDADELPNFGESNKRKRKAADSDESPAPTRQRVDNGSNTPLWFAEKYNMHATQVDSALYSIEKLFTEKELAMTYNAAALAAHKYMQRHQPYSEDIYSPPNGKSDSGSDLEKAPTTNDQDNNVNEDADSPPGGAAMERQYSHATRSTRGAGLAPNYITGLGIDALGDLNYPGNMQALTQQIPKMPPFLASVMQKGYVKGDAANQPAGLSSEDAAAELDIIRRARTYNETAGYGRNLELENGGKPLLEAVAIPKKFDYWVKADHKGLLDSKGLLTSNLRDELGSEAMSKQSSRGMSEMGGTPMSRQNTGEGGTSSRGRRLKPILAA